MDLLDKFLELNTFEISIPGLKDSSLVATNKTGIIIIIIIICFLADYNLFKNVQESGWYEEFRRN